MRATTAFRTDGSRCRHEPPDKGDLPQSVLFVLARLLLCLCQCSETIRATQEPFRVVSIVRMDGLRPQMICPREELSSRVNLHSVQPADSALRDFCHNIRRWILLTLPVSWDFTTRTGLTLRMASCPPSQGLPSWGPRPTFHSEARSAGLTAAPTDPS